MRKMSLKWVSLFLFVLSLGPTSTQATLVVEDKNFKTYKVKAVSENEVTLVSTTDSKDRRVVSRHLFKQPLVTGKTEILMSHDSMKPRKKK